MEELKCLSAEEFAARTATSAPVPGGGSVAALAGALAAALSEMVANLTIGKAKYAEAEDEMKELAAAGAAIRRTRGSAFPDLQGAPAQCRLFPGAPR